MNQPNRRAIRQDQPKVIAIAKAAPRNTVSPELVIGFSASVSLLGYLLSFLTA